MLSANQNGEIFSCILLVNIFWANLPFERNYASKDGKVSKGWVGFRVRVKKKR